MNHSTLYVFGLAVLALIAPGCSKFADANPWVDRSVPGHAISTPSADGIRAAAGQRIDRRPNWDRARAGYENQSVTHWPLWWEDPFEDKGSDDDRFAWTYEDYLALPYGLGRFLLNTMAFPISATLTHPFTVMASDGQLSKQALGFDHDAEPHRPARIPSAADAVESEQTPEPQTANAETTAAPAPSENP